MGQGRDQRQPSDRPGVVERQSQGDGAAQRMPDNQRFLQPQRVDDLGGDRRLRHDPLRRSGLRIAGAGAVEQHHATLGKSGRERIAEMVELAQHAMDEEQRRLGLPRFLAAVDHMQPQAVDLDEAALRRNEPLEEAGQHEIQQDQRGDGEQPEGNQPEQGKQQHAQVRSKCRAPSATGAKRSVTKSRK